MRSKLKSEDGAALFAALFFFLFAAVFSAFIIQKSFVNFNAVNSMKNTNSNKTSSDSDDNLDISTLISIAETIRDYIEDEQDGYISNNKINYSKLFSKKTAKDSEDNEDSKKEFKNFKAIFEGILNEEFPEEGSLEIADRKRRTIDKFFYQISFDDGILTADFKNNKDDDIFVRLTMEDKISGLDFDNTDPKTLDEIVDESVNDYLIKYGYHGSDSLFLIWNQRWLAKKIIKDHDYKSSIGLQTKLCWKILTNYIIKLFISGESEQDEKHNIQDYYLFENPRIKIIRE